ncbi:MAG: hypothetical protein IJU23_06295 [Proteobacteria bacterium]|nr:hypothetical protein [Pseudomonadota bacterium]
MKKIILTFCICGGLVFCSACSKKTDEAVLQNDPVSPEAQAQDAVPDTVIPEKTPDKANADAEESDKIHVESHDTEKKVDNMSFTLKTQTYGIEKIDARLAQAVNAFVASEIGDFNDTFGNDKDASMTVTVQQETVRADKNGVDVVLKIDRNVTGTAHPSGDVMTFMFDPETGDEVSAASLLESPAIDREKLTAGCVESIAPLLEGMEDAKSVVENALKDNSFEHLVRTDKGFRVYFAPEEIVGPYREIIQVDLEAQQVGR